MNSQQPDRTSPVPETLIFRTPLGQRLFSAFVLLVMTPVALGMTVLSLLILDQPKGLVASLIACAFVLWVLVVYVARDTQAKWGFWARLDTAGVSLRLPGARSLIHRLPRFNGSVPYADVAAIETRLESYRSFGLSAMQRIYALRRTTGDVIVLGEDRALGTSMAQPGAEALATALQVRSGAPIVDKGMVQGRGGLLLVFGAAPDAWDAPSLDAATQAVMWRRAAMTGAIPFTIVMLAWILSGLLGR